MSKKNPSTSDDKQESSKVWNGFSKVAAMLSANVARKALDSVWKAATGKQPPTNQGDTSIALPEALLWATLSGTLVAVARVLATRKASEYYARSTGNPPPGVEA